MVVFDADVETRQITVKTRDVKVDTYRDSGPGGQHKNKTDSAVRLTHIPTGTVVTATEDRSQHKNRKVAWQRLNEQLRQASTLEQHVSTNAQRQGTIDTFRSWTWCGWRDEVKGPNGQRASMKRALSGRLDALIQ